MCEVYTFIYLIYKNTCPLVHFSHYSMGYLDFSFVSLHIRWKQFLTVMDLNEPTSEKLIVLIKNVGYFFSCIWRQLNWFIFLSILSVEANISWNLSFLASYTLDFIMSILINIRKFDTSNILIFSKMFMPWK